MLINVQLQLHKHKQKLPIAYLTSWHNIFWLLIKNSQPELIIYWF